MRYGERVPGENSLKLHGRGQILGIFRLILIRVRFFGFAQDNRLPTVSISITWWRFRRGDLQPYSDTVAFLSSRPTTKELCD
jgi:hypothetical protein